MSSQTKFSTTQFVSGILGNLFEHYDTALFGLLAPFIAPLFFPTFSPLSALILTYAMPIVGIASKPLGALFFGSFGDRWGKKRALYVTLMGMAFVTCLMGLLPTYAQGGAIAPILLCLCRVLQSFFAAGEVVGSALFILEKTGEKHRSLLSSLHGSTTILGIFLASFVVMIAGRFEESFVHFWRFPFLLGSLCGVCGVLLRLGVDEVNLATTRISIRQHLRECWQYRATLFSILCVSGFSYCTYTFSCTLMNGFLPFVSSLSKQTACGMNTLLLVLDCLLLPVFGLLAKRVSKERLMGVSAALLVLFALPLFMLLDNASWPLAFLVRGVIMTLGVAFAAPYYHWAFEQAPPAMRYTLVSVGTAVGSQLIGIPSVAASLWLYQKSGWVGAPAFYLMGAAVLACMAVLPLFAKVRKVPA